jgi:hypothetical protein
MNRGPAPTGLRRRHGVWSGRWLVLLLLLLLGLGLGLTDPARADATAIFRIVRHAQASKVAISMERNEAHCILEVRDNGRETAIRVRIPIQEGAIKS